MDDLAKFDKSVLIIRILSIFSLIAGVGAVFFSGNIFANGFLPFWYHGVIFALFFLGTFGLFKTYLLKKNK